VRCRSPPGFPFRFIWVLGWSTWCLSANDPTPCTCKTNYLRVLIGHRVAHPPGCWPLAAGLWPLPIWRLASQPAGCCCCCCCRVSGAGRRLLPSAGLLAAGVGPSLGLRYCTTPRSTAPTTAVRPSAPVLISCQCPAAAGPCPLGFALALSPPCSLRWCVVRHRPAFLTPRPSVRLGWGLGRGCGKAASRPQGKVR
jgi:hypothetical protein